ncbi:unnamed protein product [marine sediment metagenome]|uniref:Antitoxin n=1 Tax=marine sediment metagenome TaxID=412755 RepID=X1A0H1_9ZZZZ
MEYLKFTDFRNHAKEYFEKIEAGESYIIIRKGNPVAKIIPFKNREKGWKRNIKKIKIKSNKTTLDYILSERSEA